MRKFAIVEAPSILGLKPTGVDTLPDALLANGLAERLNGRRAARVEAPPYRADRDPATLTLNAKEISTYSPRLADAIGSVLDNGEFPIVLGGDCSILLGSMLALRRRGRYGLLFIDGHADFYQPEVNPNGEAASMDLAFATGRGPAVITDMEGRRPLVRDEDAVAFGFRDAEEQAQYGSQPLPPPMLALDLARVRQLGVTAAAREAVSRLVREHGPDGGFWIHLDADVLDDAIMPAVDYRLPDGLSWIELAAVLRIALESERAVGMEVTIYNPKLDPDGASGRGLTAILVEALGRESLGIPRDA
jgi:arginase